MIIATTYALLAQALGWAVLHSLWQIAIIWLIFKVLSWFLRGRNQMIYGISLLAMFTAVLWFANTFSLEYTQISLDAKSAHLINPVPDAAALPIEQPPAQTSEIQSPTLFQSLEFWFESNAFLIGWAWTIGVLLLWLRLLGGWWMAQRLRRRDVIESEASFQIRSQILAKKLKINTLVRILESPHVREPLTLGFWKPVILFPVGMLIALTPAQVEALLMHELAHIRRYDYLINLFQLALETCFFYHPLFWLISRDARVRREFCCDDVVLYHTCDPILYAQTLTDLQISTLHLKMKFTMNATGKSRFSERIMRIAGISPKRESRPNWLIVMFLPALLALFSWWPSQAASAPSESTAIQVKPVLTDTIPPRKTASATPIAPRPATEGMTPDSGDKVFADQPVLDDTFPRVAIEAVKMNVLYIGVDNPLRIAAAGVPSKALQVQLLGDGTIDGGDGNYIVRPTTPGEVTVRVSRKVSGKLQLIVDQKYRVKRIPDPSASLGEGGQSLSSGGLISKGQLLANQGINALLKNFDFDAVCEVIGFEITIMPKGQNPIMLTIVGAKFSAGALQILEKLEGDGDAVFIDDIKVKCPGDINSRNIGGLAFKLKPAKEE